MNTQTYAAPRFAVDKYGFPYELLDGMLRERQEKKASNIVENVPRRPGDTDDRTLWRFACLATAQDFERAKSLLAKVKNYECATSHTLFLAGSTNLQLQDYSEAIRYLNMAIKQDPKYEECYGLRGDTYNALDRFEDAIKDYEAAAKCTPRRAKEFYSKSAFLLMKLNQPQRAIVLLDRVQINTKEMSDASFYLAKSTCLGRLKRYKEDVDAASKGIDLCIFLRSQKLSNAEVVQIRLLQERERAYKALNQADLANKDHAAYEKISKVFENDLLGK